MIKDRKRGEEEKSKFEKDKIAWVIMKKCEFPYIAIKKVVLITISPSYCISHLG